MTIPTAIKGRKISDAVILSKQCSLEELNCLVFFKPAVMKIEVYQGTSGTLFTLLFRR